MIFSGLLDVARRTYTEIVDDSLGIQKQLSYVDKVAFSVTTDTGFLHNNTFL